MSRIVGASAIVALAASILLTGCVPTRELPSGPTEEDKQRLIDSNIEASWMSLGLPETLRPPNPPFEYVTVDQWPAAVTACMTALGYTGYSSENNLMAVGEYWESQAESIDWFLCQARSQYTPEVYGLLSTEELDYLYDYNLRVLVPCLEAHGWPVADAPTREEAVSWGGNSWGWSPYFAMPEEFDPWENLRDSITWEECAPYPAGAAFDSMPLRW